MTLTDAAAATRHSAAVDCVRPAPTSDLFCFIQFAWSLVSVIIGNWCCLAINQSCSVIVPQNSLLQSLLRVRTRLASDWLVLISSVMWLAADVLDSMVYSQSKFEARCGETWYHVLHAGHSQRLLTNITTSTRQYPRNQDQIRWSWEIFCGQWSVEVKHMKHGVLRTNPESFHDHKQCSWTKEKYKVVLEVIQIKQ